MGLRKGETARGKLTWQVGQNWKPGPEVMDAFLELAGGDGVNMEWEEFEFVKEREHHIFF